MLVSIIYSYGPRGRVISNSMAEGIKKFGDDVKNIQEEFYSGPDCDAAVFYGLRGKLRDAFNDYKRVGKKAVYIDLGYWERIRGGKLYGFHKMAVNDRHPTEYFQKRNYPIARFHQLGVKIEPWKKDGKHILIAGMGAKAATFEGFHPNEWELAAVGELSKYTDRPIIYRPKPSWRSATPVDGTTFSAPDTPLEADLLNCHAVVAHHSNVCVDALVAGIPAFCMEGVAVPLSLQDLSKIETPIYPDGRDQWAANVAYTQWRPEEMQIGSAWRHLREEGIV